MTEIRPETEYFEGRTELPDSINPLPGVSFAAQIYDRGPAGIIASKIVSYRCLQLMDGCNSQHLLPGVELPLTDNLYPIKRFRSVLKVISDRRRDLDSTEQPSKLLDENAFRERTKRMKEPGIYLGPPAPIVEHEGNGASSLLVRSVGYYQVAPSGEQLSGVTSDHLLTFRFRLITPTLLRQVKVGSVYSVRANETFEAIAASVLRPSASIMLKAKRRSFSFSPLYQPV
jgi:hypothetical protein